MTHVSFRSTRPNPGERLMRGPAICPRALASRACWASCALLGWVTLALAQDRATIEAGEQLYEEHCATCHGEKLRSTGSMPDLRELGADARTRFDQLIMKGKGQMPSYQGVISGEQLDQLWSYIRSRASR
jgi:mono/diheme cytochrome c family protein